MRDHMMGWTGLVNFIEREERPSAVTPAAPRRTMEEDLERKKKDVQPTSSAAATLKPGVYRIFLGQYVESRRIQSWSKWDGYHWFAWCGSPVRASREICISSIQNHKVIREATAEELSEHR
jgi:hypothetical protein